MAENPTSIVSEACKKFYSKGWALAPGTGIALREGDRVFAPPAEVHLDRLEPEDIFTLAVNLDSKGNPELYPDATNPAFNISPHTTLFLRMFEEFDCSCILYGQPQSALVVAAINQTQFRIKDQRAITLISNGETKETWPSSHELCVPIIPSCDDQEELFIRLEKAFGENPESNAVLIRGNGLVVCGDSWAQTSIMFEALISLFSLSIEMRKVGLENTNVTLKNLPSKKAGHEVEVIKSLSIIKPPISTWSGKPNTKSEVKKNSETVPTPPKSTWSGRPRARVEAPPPSLMSRSLPSDSTRTLRISSLNNSINNDLALRKKRLALARLRVAASADSLSGPSGPYRRSAASFMRPPSYFMQRNKEPGFVIGGGMNPGSGGGMDMGNMGGGMNMGNMGGMDMGNNANMGNGGWGMNKPSYPEMPPMPPMRNMGDSRMGVKVGMDMGSGRTLRSSGLFRNLNKVRGRGIVGVRAPNRRSVKDRLGFKSGISVDPGAMSKEYSVNLEDM